MTDSLVCWKCGAPIIDQPLPLGRVAECSACRADLHACRMCAYYDTRMAASCREPVAEDVLDKERANFCPYFAARPGAHSEGNELSAAARAQLDALFGAGADEAKCNNNKADSRSEVEVAREQLEQLFGSGKKGDI
jgi:hypothetical protein